MCGIANILIYICCFCAQAALLAVALLVFVCWPLPAQALQTTVGPKQRSKGRKAEHIYDMNKTLLLLISLCRPPAFHFDLPYTGICEADMLVCLGCELLVCSGCELFGCRRRYRVVPKRNEVGACSVYFGYCCLLHLFRILYSRSA